MIDIDTQTFTLRTCEKFVFLALEVNWHSKSNRSLKKSEWVSISWKKVLPPPEPGISLLLQVAAPTTS